MGCAQEEPVCGDDRARTLWSLMEMPWWYTLWHGLEST